MSQESPAAQPPSASPDLESSFSGPSPTRLAVLLLITCLLAYLPALFAGFIWDDSGHVTREDLRSLGGLLLIWTEPGATQQYYPLLHSAFWLEHFAFGDTPFGYHLLNVLLHACSAFLFFTLLRRLAVPGAWLAALLFAVHPVCVESVAWVAEQKNTLSLVFYLCAVLLYLRFDENRKATSFLAATALFIAALLTKTVTATLPAALLVVLWWKRGSLSWKKDILPLLPWFALAGAAGTTTAWMEHHFIGAEGAGFALTWPERLLIAGRAVWFYCSKIYFPQDLTFIYPRWHLDATAWWQWLFPVAAIALLGVLFKFRTRTRAPLAAALLFGGALFPALGFINVYPFTFSFVADHFQYLACLPLFALTGAFLHARLEGLGSWLANFAAGCLVVLLALLTAHQALGYRDLVTLYETTLEKNPTCWLAHNNLGIELLAAEDPEKALDHFLQALELRPDYPQACSNAGDALNRLSRPREALPYLEKALALEPAFADAHNNLGVSLLTLGKNKEGIEHFKKAIVIEPRLESAYFNLAQALASTDHIPEALPCFDKAVQLNPTHYDAQFSYAMTLAFIGKMTEAEPHFQRALELRPDDFNTRLNYGKSLLQAGRSEKAVEHLRAAVKLDAESADAKAALAQALRRTGRPEEAVFFEREAQRLTPAR